MFLPFVPISPYFYPVKLKLLLKHSPCESPVFVRHLEILFTCGAQVPVILFGN
jgi:hypothetical protein